MQGAETEWQEAWRRSESHGVGFAKLGRRLRRSFRGLMAALPPSSFLSINFSSTYNKKLFTISKDPPLVILRELKTSIFGEFSHTSTQID